MHGCAESNFVDQTAGTNNDRMIMTRGTTSAFDYPCMTIRAGQSVIFMWAFSRHPLAPGLAPGETGTPSEMSPIAAHNTGSVYTVRFPSAGVFPFFCSVHPGTMKGVVRVVP
jgi:plastocyanin